VLLAFSPQVDYLIPITMQEHPQTPVTGLCAFPVTVSCNEEIWLSSRGYPGDWRMGWLPATPHNNRRKMEKYYYQLSNDESFNEGFVVLEQKGT
jgi:hypothetical protein